MSNAAALTLAVDCMGGDHGLETTLPACVRFLRKRPQVRVLLVGLPDVLPQRWQATPGAAEVSARVEFVAASEVVTMDDPVEVALRKKKNSSMRVAVEQVRDGKADAAVSAGNTGALMAISRYVLKTLDGIDRPAIASLLPNVKGEGTLMLDLGANVDCTPEHLLQFALMGSALVAALSGKERPTVGLLNIGEEMIKGNEVIKRTSELLTDAGQRGVINFYGNVEGNDVYKGTTDLVVCDGFVGNVALKASEGLASMVGNFLRQEFSRNPLRKLAAIAAYPVMAAFKQRLDQRRYNGAALLGLRGLVLKSHGGADDVGFEYALEHAADAAQRQVLRGVEQRVQALLSAA